MARFSDRLKELRLSHGLSRQGLSNMIDISKSSINMYERGDREPGIEAMEAIADYFNVDMDFLFGKSDIKNKYILPNESDDRQMGFKPSFTPAAQRIARAYEKATPPVKKTVEVALEPWMDNASPTYDDEEEDKCELPTYDMPAAAGLGNYLDSASYDIVSYPAKDVPPRADICVKITGNSMEPDITDGCVVFVETKHAIEPGQIGIFVLNENSYCKRLVIDNDISQVRLESLNSAYEPIIISEDDDLRTVGRVLGVAERS